jgi:membrane protease YdiL (CAAX protease family)
VNEDRIPFSYLLAVAWTFLSAALLMLLLRASVAIRPAAASDIVQRGAIEALVFVLCTFGLLRLHAPDLPLRSAFGLRPTHPALAGFGLLLGFVLHFPAESVDALVEKFFPVPSDEIVQRAALLSVESPSRVVALLVVVACVGPLVEELFYRGALFGVLRRGHPLAGTTAVTASCFVMGHLDYRMWPALAVVSVTMTHLRAVCGSLLPGLALHVAFNAVTVLALVTGQSSVAEPPKLSLLPAVAGWVATLALVAAIQYVASRAEDARTGRAEDAE